MDSIIIYNPKTGAAINYVWAKKKWALAVNEMKKFPKEIADQLLLTYPFLEQVDIKNIKDIKKRMKVNPYKCKYCKFETDQKIALIGHLRSHDISEEDEKLLSGIESAGTIDAEPKKILSEEEVGGIPSKGEDKDGVEWYGPGVESDNLKDKE